VRHAEKVRRCRRETRVYTVLNLAGNRFRLISEIYYEDQVLLVREILTRAEYDKENWKR
jgi:mRNA interferase HigB